MAAAALMAGCHLVLGIEDLSSQEPMDAPVAVLDASVDHAVRGTATGVLGPVALELRLGGATELLNVTEDGDFSFQTRLQPGASYAVVLPIPDTPCLLQNQTGMIADADAAIELACTGASLASVVVSGMAPVVELMPGKSEYTIDVPLSQSSAIVTAAVATDGDTIKFVGKEILSGMPSELLTLNLGDNPIDIVVENSFGWRRTYRLTLRRAARLAQYAYGKASNADIGDEFGISLALSGDTLAIGAFREDSKAVGINGDQTDNSRENSGAVYVFRRSGTSWRQEAYVKASNAQTGDNFGIEVALDGDTLAVGAWGEDSASTGINGNQSDESASSSGAVYVFRRSDTAWSQEAYLKAFNTGAGDNFGYKVVLSGDALAVSAFREDSAATGIGGNSTDDTVADSGAVYVFRRSGLLWQQEAYVKASNTGAGDEFGSSVALSGDILVVGAAREDSEARGIDGDPANNNAENSGAVYVFRRNGTSWQQEAYVKASNTGRFDFFGMSAALSGDTFAVGASAEDSAATGINGNEANDSAVDSGAVYVFRRSEASWLQEAYIKASNTGDFDFLGVNVALSGDNLAAGARHEDSMATGVNSDQANAGSQDSGAAYVFRRTGTTWHQEAYVKASNTGDNDSFGYSVAVSGDTVAVGALWEASDARGIDGDQASDLAEESGAVYIFH
jgi:hypothetical protein